VEEAVEKLIEGGEGMNFLRRAAAAVDRLNDLMGSATSWLVLAMVLMGAYNALARWATRYVGIPLSSNALNEIQWYMFSIIFLLGAAHGLRHDVHVRVDVLRERLSERGRAWIDLFGTTLLLVPFCVLMLWVSWTPVVRSWQVREVSPDPGGLSRWPIKALLLVCFGLLLLQGLAMVVRQLDAIRERGMPEGPRIGPAVADVRQEEGP
jgi:TRAP-type mannitol/chloroaromatic compound transport system permease small subunit